MLAGCGSSSSDEYTGYGDKRDVSALRVWRAMRSSVSIPEIAAAIAEELGMELRSRMEFDSIVAGSPVAKWAMAGGGW